MLRKEGRKERTIPRREGIISRKELYQGRKEVFKEGYQGKGTKVRRWDGRK